MKEWTMKNRRWIMGLFCILCMMLLIPQRAEAATSYKKIYKTLLSKKKITAENTTFTPNWYYMINIDKKGTPELIVTSNGGGVTSYHVYTVSGGKAKYLGSYGARGINMSQPTFTYSSKYKGLIAEGWTNFIGGAWSNMYVISGSKLKWKYHAMSSYDSSGKQVYDVKTTYKKVSKSSYNSYWKKYFKTRKTYKMKKNTAANRKKSFG